MRSTFKKWMSSQFIGSTRIGMDQYNSIHIRIDEHSSVSLVDYVE